MLGFSRVRDCLSPESIKGFRIMRLGNNNVGGGHNLQASRGEGRHSDEGS